MTKRHTGCGVLLLLCAMAAISAPAQVLTTLHSFSGAPAEGDEPVGALMQATDGNFYGTTLAGGVSDDGTIFKMTPTGSVTTLYSFRGTDGMGPQGALIKATDGNFYGTTTYGGMVDCTFGCGTVFKLTPSGTLTTLYTFCSTPGCADGSEPYAGLIQASDGNFYGTTTSGGGGDCDGGCGTVFQITPDGALTTLYTFQGCEIDGESPHGVLLQASDGNFYGTTFGGVGCVGTVFKMTPDGALSTLHSFAYTDGSGPFAGLIQASDGNFYGTTAYGGMGEDGEGTVFKITPSGTLTTLHTFDGTDGGFALGLMQGRSGNFYGMTSYDGPRRFGTIFQITPGGTLTTLHSFDGPDSPGGTGPSDGLIQAMDGNFYGTTYGGGVDGYGTVFRLITLRPCIHCATAR